MANTMLKKSAKVAGKVNPAKLQETASTIRFSAKLIPPESSGKIGSWTLLALPRNARPKLPSRETTMVEGTMNGFPFRAALESNGSGIHWLRVNEALRDAAGADVGDMVTVEITRVGEEPECRVPLDLRKALEAAPSAQASWTDITPMARRDWVLSIISVKQEETRKRRIEITCDKLASGMRRPCCFPGINWRRKDSDVTSDETWLPLPNSKSRSSARSTL
jgi:Bacteriocin-protection, YdeI or OmpD-Associated/Domain of unknown function (DUF1905)